MSSKQYDVVATIINDESDGITVAVTLNGFRAAEVDLRRSRYANTSTWEVKYSMGARTWAMHELGGNLAVLSMVAEVGRSLTNEAAKLNATGTRERTPNVHLW